MNNPLLYIDPDGRDTLRMNRQYLSTIGNTDIYYVTFSYISNGAETQMALPDDTGSLYMFGNHIADQKGANSMNDQEVYPISFEQMKSRENERGWENTIKLSNKGRGLFIHPANKNEHLDGCKSVSDCYKTDKEGEVKFVDSVYYLDQIRSLYNSVESRLTGEKFQLKNIETQSNNEN